MNMSQAGLISAWETMRLWDEVREWLRMHGDWDMTISLWGPFGCLMVAVTYRSEIRWTDKGRQLDKRLRNAIEFMKTQGGSK